MPGMNRSRRTANQNRPGYKLLEVPLRSQQAFPIRQRLVLRVHSDEQFVFLIADDPPMVCPRLDHFGMSVGTLADFEDLWAKVEQKAAADPDVDAIAPTMENHYDVLKLHSFYVRYKLPMMVEVQHFEYCT